jgi:haloalkane dehalogenase
MTVLRTPEDRFNNIPDFPYAPNYIELEDSDLGTLRLAYIDEGPKDAAAVLCMHGEPSWSFLYRKMIPIFLEAGYRVIAPDLIGFGRSDKPANRTDYTYQKHVNWMGGWLRELNLNDITLIAQDWGGLIGLRLVAEMPERFARVSISNTGLPTGDEPMSEDFLAWKNFSQTCEEFDAGFIVNIFDHGSLTPEEKKAYRAPFPTELYAAGAREFPMLVPVSPDNAASQTNRDAWKVLLEWKKPFLLCFSDADPILGPLKVTFEKIPGTEGQPHTTLHGMHFIQEQDGERWATAVVDWMN